MEAKPPSGVVVLLSYMSSRTTPFIEWEFYHIFTRGIDKRNTFMDVEDAERFLLSMDEFNTTEPIGSIYEESFRKLSSKESRSIPKSKIVTKPRKQNKLVNFVCYCINPNHYHFILEQLVPNGIQKFMQRLGTGYTLFFNKKYKRTGALFQGPFKAIHIDSNEYLLHLSVYINLNGQVHQLGGEASKLVRSSWEEYVDKNKNNFCSKNIILKQFRSPGEYRTFAKEALVWIKENKDAAKYLLE